MNHASLTQNQAYKDQTVLITDSYIKIFKYYFPLATSKTIVFQDIQEIRMEDSKDLDVVWGPSSSHLNNWFPFELQRKYRKKIIQIIMKNRSIRPSFTPIDPETVFKILWQRHTFQGRKYNQDSLIQNSQKKSKIAHERESQVENINQKMRESNVFKKKNQENEQNKEKQINEVKSVCLKISQKNQQRDSRMVGTQDKQNSLQVKNTSKTQKSLTLKQEPIVQISNQN